MNTDKNLKALNRETATEDDILTAMALDALERGWESGRMAGEELRALTADCLAELAAIPYENFQPVPLAHRDYWLTVLNIVRHIMAEWDDEVRTGFFARNGYTSKALELLVI